MNTRIFAGLCLIVLALMFGCSSGPGERWTAVRTNTFGIMGRTVRVTGLMAPDGAGRPWLAVGSQMDSHRIQGPLGWSSPDGATWSHDRFIPDTLDGPLDHLFGLARRDGVAITDGETQSVSEGNLRPTVWHRDADGAWHEVHVPREMFGGERGGGLIAVAAGPTGFVVVGGWTGLDDHFDIGVWNSPDGKTMTRLDGDTGLSPRGNESIRAIAAAGGPAGFVIAGEVDLGAARLGAAWWSADGRKWLRSDVAGSASLEQVVAVPGGYLALGLRSDGTPQAWLSADGRSWRPGGRLPGGGRPFAVTLTGTAVAGSDVIVGGVSAGRVLLWRTAGVGWRSLGLGGGLGALAPVSSVVVGANPSTVLVAVNLPDRPQLWRLGG